MKEEIVTIEAHRGAYNAAIAAKKTMTVGELIELLQEDYDESMPIIISNDEGYTFGTIRPFDIGVTRAEVEED
jgi:hypothetical protein